MKSKAARKPVGVRMAASPEEFRSDLSRWPVLSPAQCIEKCQRWEHIVGDAVVDPQGTTGRELGLISVQLALAARVIGLPGDALKNMARMLGSAPEGHRSAIGAKWTRVMGEAGLETYALWGKLKLYNADGASPPANRIPETWHTGRWYSKVCALNSAALLKARRTVQARMNGTRWEYELKSVALRWPQYREALFEAAGL